MNDLICISNFSKSQERINRRTGKWMLWFNIIITISYLVMFLIDIMNVLIMVLMFCTSLCGILFGLYMLSEARNYKVIGDIADEILFAIKKNEERKDKERKSVLYFER